MPNPVVCSITLLVPNERIERAESQVIYLRFVRLYTPALMVKFLIGCTYPIKSRIV